MKGNYYQCNAAFQEPEKKRRIEELRRELKELEAVPRSDWHKAFEAFLNLRIAKYDGVRIDKEEGIHC